jgi:hypothetical protein
MIYKVSTCSPCLGNSVGQHTIELQVDAAESTCYFNSYFALGKHLSQYLSITTASGSLNKAWVVATAPHIMQNPGDFFGSVEAGFVSKGFIA